LINPVSLRFWPLTTRGFKRDRTIKGKRSSRVGGQCGFSRGLDQQEARLKELRLDPQFQKPWSKDEIPVRFEGGATCEVVYAKLEEEQRREKNVGEILGPVASRSADLLITKNTSVLPSLPQSEETQKKQGL
jgi:hypothetical protein